MKGVYALYLHLPVETTVTVGALGEHTFPESVYCYVGSAQNGIEHRIIRHLSGRGKPHWHVDYLRAHAQPVGWQALHGNAGYECVLARFLEQTGDAVEGFGCSDCGCDSHLFRL